MRPFRLAAVLAHRERREAVLQEEHSAALVRRQQALAALHAAQADQERASVHLTELQCDGILDMAALERTVRYLEQLGEAVRQHEQNVQRRRHEAEAAHAALVRAAQDRRALERLKERHDAAQRQDAERREASEHDSLATARFGRRRQALSSEP